MSGNESQEVVQELRIIRGLLVASLLRSMEGATQRETIALLSNSGIGPSEIAAIVGTTPGTVSVALVDLRKAGKVRRVTKSEKVGANNGK